MKLNFNQYEDMTNIVDSLELPSGLTICSLTTDDGYCEILTQGSTVVDYNGSTYYDVIKFPEELKELIHSGKLWESEDVFVDMNNWFEIFYGDTPKDCYANSDVIDIEGFTTEKLLNTCLDYIQYYKKQKEK